jgi:hypothetical protein
VQSLRTGDDRHLTKRFQFHKIHLFRTFFRQWDYVFYLDSNFHIRLDVQPLLDQRAPYTLVAPDDDYPRFQVVLRDQFDTTSEVFPPLEQGYDMGCRYFQTGLMLFDTRLITDSTFWEIENLILRHPCCMTNEQGFLSLYFASIQKCWKPLVMENGVSYYYGFSMRDRSVPCILYKGTL